MENQLDKQKDSGLYNGHTTCPLIVGTEGMEREVETATPGLP